MSKTELAKDSIDSKITSKDTTSSDLTSSAASLSCSSKIEQQKSFISNDNNNNNEVEDDACSNNEDYNYYDDDDDYGYGDGADGLDGGDLVDDVDEDDDPYSNDPEYFDYEMYPINKIDFIMQKKFEKLRNHLKLEDTFDIIYLLKQFKWNPNTIIDLYEKDKQQFLQTYFSDKNNNKSKSAETACCLDRTKLTSYLNIFNDTTTTAATTSKSSSASSASTLSTLDKEKSVHKALIKSTIEPDPYCAVCCSTKSSLSEIDCLPECLHYFCLDCWRTNFEMQIKMNSTSFFECMESKCNSIANKEFVLKCLNHKSSDAISSKDKEEDERQRIKSTEQYKRLVAIDLVKESDDFQLCPGEVQTIDKGAKTTKKCNSIAWAKQKPAARRVQCSTCDSQYCFLCSLPYHAPNACDTIREWNLKCQDDSETRNYLLVHTQDCPKCKVCIEKNGGCSHMTCNRCKHEFCWVCLNDWKTHGTTYDCNRYKGNPEQDNAREALNRYTHYYHRWINHANSLKFEKALKEQCRLKIQEKIMNKGGGTLVDWEFLNEATDLLTKARYTLQYTYPYAYYSENKEYKFLFENIQAELEREVENLSHSLEKVNLNDKYNIKTQMTIVEKRRKTLLKDFIQ